MSHSLIFKFNNYNEAIARSLRYVGNNLFVDIVIDNEVFSRVESSKSFDGDDIPCGEHYLYCILYYEESNGDVEKYKTDVYKFNLKNTDAIFTLNLYFITMERGNHGFDFGPGDIPIRDKKDRKNKSGGCFVATCVYGSYDCPEVWTLRRYRDQILAKTWYGRTFIKTYYFISPSLVRWFGNRKWFKSIFTPWLNKIVSSLNDKGIENTNYEDKK